MGRLIRFELKKMLSGKFFWIALCLLLAVNILLSCGAWELYNLFMDADENVLSTAEEGFSFFDYFTSSRHATESMRRRYGVLAEISQEERDAFEAAMEEKYGQDIWEYLVPTEEMLTVPGYFGGNLSDLDYISAYTDMKKWNAEIEETYQNVLRSAKAYGREALEEGDNYAVRRNLNIIRLYSTPRREITSPFRAGTMICLNLAPCCWCSRWCCWPAPGAFPASGTGRPGCCSRRRGTAEARPSWPNTWPGPQRQRDLQFCSR